MHKLKQCLLHITLGLICLMGLGQVAATETITYYHTDILGSPIAATDKDGNVLWRENYKPYGERLKDDAMAKASENSVWYTGHAEDRETDLIYMGARWYDPVLGRFMGIDPVGVDLNNVHSFNRYAYANNNPYAFVDPDGRVPVPLIIWIGKEIVSSVAEHYAGVPLSFKGLAKHGIRYFGKNVGDDVAKLGNSVTKNARKQRNSLPETGEPNSVVSNLPGTSMRKYGRDGEAVKDFNKGHGPNVRNLAESGDHVHDIAPKTHPKQTLNQLRGTGRELNEQDVKDFGLDL